MLTPNDIADRLAELVENLFPGEQLHRELTPQGFERPCNLIVLDGCKGVVAYGTQIVELQPTFTLTTFVAVDEYHHSHLAELHRRQMLLTGLLMPGYIKVGDRAVKVAGDIVLAGGYDYDTVTVPFSYTLSRQDFEKPEQHPDMGQLHLRTEVTTYG